MSVDQIKPQEGPQTEFLSTRADIAIYGGAAGGGKSYGLLLEPLRHYKNPNFSGVIFRRTYPQIMNEGGLWDTSLQIYPKLNAIPKTSICKWVFPSGMSIRFTHLQHEKDLDEFMGAQIPFIGFDELTHFTERMFFYLLSRNRSAIAGVKPYIRATTNPDANSWVKKFLAPWVDSEWEGVRANSGEIRYFIRENGVVRWVAAGTPKAKSVTFIRSSVYDNKILLQTDPEYLHNLEALPLVERLRFLEGDWDISESGNMFKSEWFDPLYDTLPGERRWRVCRYWDIAASEVRPGRDPDWTAGCLLAMDDFRNFFICDMVMLQNTPAVVERTIRQVAEADYAAFGSALTIAMEQEPGASGVTVIDHFKNTVLRGFNFIGHKTSGSKVERAKTVSGLAEHGKVKMLRAGWNTKFLSFATRFPSQGVKDDPIDALSGAYAVLTSPPTAGCFVDPLERIASFRFAADEPDLTERAGNGFSYTV